MSCKNEESQKGVQTHNVIGKMGRAAYPISMALLILPLLLLA